MFHVKSSLIRNQIFFLTLFLGISAFSSRLQAQPSSLPLTVIVPVYRELKNQNLALFLLSFARQKSQSETLENLELFFVVNHTVDTPAEIVTENKATLAVLSSLASGQMPMLDESQDLLEEASREILRRGVKIKVLDHTSPGFADNNIGRVRNLGAHHLLSEIPAAESSHHIIAQMDADTRVPSNYWEEAQRAFANPAVAFALTDLQYGIGSDSPPEIYRRLIVGQLSLAAVNLKNAMTGNLPKSATPRILCRAEALATVNGVPELQYFEDAGLIERLKEAFPGRGAYLDTVLVLTSYRGREDGYEAAKLYEKRFEEVGLPQSVSNYVSYVDERLSFAGLFLPQLVRTHQLLEKEILENEIIPEIVARRKMLRARMSELVDSGEWSPRGLGEDLFFRNAWIEDYLREKLGESHGDVEAAFQTVSQDFPHLLQLPVPKETKAYIKLRAATETSELINDRVKRNQMLMALDEGEKSVVELKVKKLWINLEIKLAECEKAWSFVVAKFYGLDKDFPWARFQAAADAIHDEEQFSRLAADLHEEIRKSQLQIGVLKELSRALQLRHLLETMDNFEALFASETSASETTIDAQKRKINETVIQIMGWMALRDAQRKPAWPGWSQMAYRERRSFKHETTLPLWQSEGALKELGLFAPYFTTLRSLTRPQGQRVYDEILVFFAEQIKLEAAESSQSFLEKLWFAYRQKSAALSVDQDSECEAKVN